MNKGYPRSIEEEESLNALGGFESAVRIADRILARHGLCRGLFTQTERDQVQQGRLQRCRVIKFRFAPGKSLLSNIENLFHQAQALQKTAGGTN